MSNFTLLFLSLIILIGVFMYLSIILRSQVFSTAFIILAICLFFYYCNVTFCDTNVTENVVISTQLMETVTEEQQDLLEKEDTNAVTKNILLGFVLGFGAVVISYFVYNRLFAEVLPCTNVESFHDFVEETSRESWRQACEMLLSKDIQYQFDTIKIWLHAPNDIQLVFIRDWLKQQLMLENPQFDYLELTQILECVEEVINALL